MKISYLITCHNEYDTFKNLLEKIDYHVCKVNNKDEIVILDDFSTDNRMLQLFHNITDPFLPTEGIKVIYHALNNNYGAHKNFGIEQCTGDYIFQLDGDELPPESLLGENLHSLLDTNPKTEAFAIPRINDFRGVTEVHAKQWGWRLTISPTYKRPIVNFPDYQFRIFKKDYPRISYTRRLHEKIEGYSSYIFLPPEEEWALYHDKTIEKQVETNLRYNQAFTQQENMGHRVK